MKLLLSTNFRESLTARRGGFMPVDQAHEQAYNLPLKEALLRNRQNINILENLGNWLHIRGRIINAFNEFVFPSSAWVSKENDDAVKENLTENKREDDKLQKIVDHISERMKVDFDSLLFFKTCSKELISFEGQKLEPEAEKKLLDSRNIGEAEYTKFVRERMIHRTIPVNARVKKTNIPIFPYLDSKKPKKNMDRKELLTTNKLLGIINDRPLIAAKELNHFQFTPINALVSCMDSTGKLIPNLRGNKSSAINNYIRTNVPESFSNDRPSGVDLIILEGENLLACQPSGKKTVEEHIQSLFKYKIKDHFNFAPNILLMFDEDISDRKDDLKMTAEKRYDNEYQDLQLHANYEITDWAVIFKNQKNKKQFKSLFKYILMQSVGEYLEVGQNFYMNGLFDDGITKSFIKNELGYLQIENVDIWKLSKAESDTKIFEVCRAESTDQKVLIFSVDTDVKMLSIYWSARLCHENLIIRSGSGLAPIYFYPQTVVDFFFKNYNLQVGNTTDYAEALLTAYAYFGCDYNPGFHQITHGHGLNTFHELSKEAVLRTSEDFLKLTLTAYSRKHKSMQKLFQTSDDATVDERIMHMRGVLKAMKGNEKDTIPLPSVLKLHYKRSRYIRKMWLGRLEDHDLPQGNGWISSENRLEINIQDIEDKYFNLPIQLLRGCGCKSAKCGNRCQCVKRDQNCSRFTCKNCQCFKRQKDNEDEDLALSHRFQDFLDQLSSSDDQSTDESGDENEQESYSESENDDSALNISNSEDEFEFED